MMKNEMNRQPYLIPCSHNPLTITAGILPTNPNQNEQIVPREIQHQTINLIANLFSFLGMNRGFRLKSVILYISHHEAADQVLAHIRNAGIGGYVTNCTVMKLREGVHVGMDATAEALPILRSKL